MCGRGKLLGTKPPLLPTNGVSCTLVLALDEEGLLTRLGRKMAEFPFEPQLSKRILLSVDLGCSKQIPLIITAMLSVDNPFFRSRDKQDQSDFKKGFQVWEQGLSSPLFPSSTVSAVAHF